MEYLKNEFLFMLNFKKKKMKPFIVKFSIFSISLFCAFCVLEHRLKQIPNSYNTKKNLFETQAKDIEVLVLGSSAALYGINPKYFSVKGFNLANVGQTIYYDVELTHKYLEKMKNIKCIIYDLPYLLLWYPVDDLRNYYYYYFWDIKASDFKWYDLKNYSLALIYSPDTVLKLSLNYFIPQREYQIYNNGFMIKTIIKPFNDIGNIVATSHEKLRDRASILKNIAILKNFALECKLRNIKLSFTITPQYPSYYNNLNPNICRLNRSIIQNLCKRYNCEFHDYSNDKRFVQTDFYDPIHMNATGAQKFSSILNEEILK